MSVVAGRLDASKSPYRGPELSMKLSEVREKAARGEAMLVNAKYLVELVEAVVRLERENAELRARLGE